jgi:hypothetical protein
MQESSSAAVHRKRDAVPSDWAADYVEGGEKLAVIGVIDIVGESRPYEGKHEPQTATKRHI